MILQHHSYNGDDPLDLAVVDQNRNPVPHKPFGFWLSVGPAWRDWCRANEFGCGKFVSYWQLDMKEVFWLSRPEDFARLPARAETPEGHYPDWAELAKTYKGILCYPYMQPSRLRYAWYSTLDVPSASIWDPSCLTRLDLG